MTMSRIYKGIFLTALKLSFLWLTNERRSASFQAGIIVRDPYRESPTHREQSLNLRRT